MACDRVVSDLMEAWDSARLPTTSTQWNVPGRYGPYGKLFFFLLEKEPMVLRELSRLGPSIRPHGEFLLLLMHKKPTFVPDSEACIGGGFLVPELKDGSEASEDDQTDNVSNEALHVIGLHGSGDKVSRYLQDWEVARVALSCHVALDMPCQELYEVDRRRDWFGF